MAWWSEAPSGARDGPADRDGWLPAGLNAGWTYPDQVEHAAASVAAFYAARYPHSALADWQGRLAAGEIHRNGEPLLGDGPLQAGDRLAWYRPPWREEAVPAAWEVVHDDGDVLVIDKPSGLPVLPAGGWLEHTVLRLLERRHGTDPAGVPRPVHRLGRFTSGLLVCARQGGSRRWLSARLRESTAAAAQVDAPAPTCTPKVAGTDGALASLGADPQPPACQKVYQALLAPGGLPAALAPGEACTIRTPIGRRPHPRLGLIWCATGGEQAGDLPACSTLTLLERGLEGDRVEVAIATGRPHQVRIHCAAIGAPLRGDPLYLPGGLARQEGLPGDGGYLLRAQRLAIQRPDGDWLRLALDP